jgi:hypothetical protein
MNYVHTRIVVCCYRGRVGTDLSVVWVAYWSVYVLLISKFNSIHYSVTVTRCCSYSYFVLLKMGCWWCTKHVEQLSDKINCVTCASCWTYI